MKHRHVGWQGNRWHDRLRRDASTRRVPSSSAWPERSPEACHPGACHRQQTRRTRSTGLSIFCLLFGFSAIIPAINAATSPRRLAQLRRNNPAGSCGAGQCFLAHTARAGLISRSPSTTPSVPTTITSGFSRSTSTARPRPNQRPASATTSRAAGSPSNARPIRSRVVRFGRPQAWLQPVRQADQPSPAAKALPRAGLAVLERAIFGNAHMAQLRRPYRSTHDRSAR